MYPLENRIQTYAWGSHTALAELLGAAEPSEVPQAELWMGAHPQGSSRALVDGRWVSLADAIARRPHVEIGADVVTRFGERLPFLLKVLAVDNPLSLQAHPTLEQAKAGFEAEEAAGIPRDAPNRNYRDPSHKPELLCALTPFEALCGFRPIPDTLRLIDELDVPELEPLLKALRARPAASELRALFIRLMLAEGVERSRLVTATCSACTRLVSNTSEPRPEYLWALRTAERYPGDIGVVTMLLLNWIHLEPNEAIYVPAGRLHAYLSGVGIEIQSSSDNVLRGGLTSKHVNIPELVRILDFEPQALERVRTRTRGREHIYQTTIADFRLSRIDLGQAYDRAALERSASFLWTTPDRSGPEILLGGSGTLEAKYTDDTARVPLDRAASVFVPASAGTYSLAGTGHAYRATLGDPNG